MAWLRLPSSVAKGSLRFLAVAAVVALSAGHALAATRYVDPSIAPASCTTYSTAARSCTGGSALGYKTIASASSAAVAGDTIQIRQGTYTSQLAPSTSGSPGAYITYENYPGETVTITISGSNTGISILSKQYLIIKGLTVSDVSGWGRVEDSNHIIFQSNAFSIARSSGTSSALKFVGSDYNKLVQNSFDDGNDNVMLQDSDFNVITGNAFTKARHTLLVIACGNNNVVRNNTFANTLEKGGETFDCEGAISGQTRKLNATKRNLWEDNKFTYTKFSTSQSDYNGIQFAGQEGIVRRNLFYDNEGGGFGLQVYPDEALYVNGNRIYNNTFYNNHCYGIWTSNDSDSTYYDNIIKNNLLYKNVNCTGGATQTLNGNAAKAAYVNNSILTVSPHFVYEANRDFRLVSDSSAIDAGAFLTTTASAGSGTALPVADANYFYDGYGLEGEQGDLIQLAGQVERARIVSVDLAAKVLHLDRSLTWGSGTGVALSYNGASPDTGALEAPGAASAPTAPANLRIVSQ